MLICGICGLASHLDSCPSCGAPLKNKLESGEHNDLKDIFSKDVELPFDLQTPSVNISNVPAFGLDDSPMPDKVENVSENNEKSPFSRFGGSGNRSNIALKTVSKITSIFGSNFDGFWTDFGGFSAPKIDQNRYQFRDRFLEGLKIGWGSLIRGSE